jgi:hypothetical protein
MGSVPMLEALLGFRVDDEVREAPRSTLRGLPVDVDDDSIREDAFIVDDTAARSDLGEVLDHARFCTRKDAELWVASGRAHLFADGYMVTDPESLGASWATLPEFDRIVSLFAAEHPGPVLRAVLAAMKSLETDGYDTRLIYWAAK